jgi:hypothetical protein
MPCKSTRAELGGGVSLIDFCSVHDSEHLFLNKFNDLRTRTVISVTNSQHTVKKGAEAGRSQIDVQRVEYKITVPSAFCTVTFVEYTPCVDV